MRMIDNAAEAEKIERAATLLHVAARGLRSADLDQAAAALVSAAEILDQVAPISTRLQ